MTKKESNPDTKEWWSAVDAALGRIEIRLTNIESVFMNLKRDMVELRRSIEHFNVELESIKNGDYCILFHQREAMEQAMPQFVTTLSVLSQEIQEAMAKIGTQVETLRKFNGKD